jgi:translation initiation factor IF-1
MFNVGDRVLVTRSWEGMNDSPATIVVPRDSGGLYGVRLDERNPNCHDLGGRVPDGFGKWTRETELKANETKEEKKMDKFNVGDRVMVRFWDDMEAEYGLDSVGDVAVRGATRDFVKRMKHLCGRQATISATNGVEFSLTDWSDKSGDTGFRFNSFMFRLVKKAEPKKKLTVAEVEKLLGYGVEFVKEGV